ncbi:galactose-1-phosphate uridylyltransferase [Algimonas arctica]|uniref:Galactose-1-phosphate uridylyltransferase n=1 Tax=Algimonas arctica TaxID=1479486 RepID=A0A8J3G1B5_9PROT|nr:galactose-1-phosphate uridylyltransferase [Algimonas arctica]GHA84809.1 galactose-1-phosphate uridylyltransferase [Algimonas arctica]
MAFTTPLPMPMLSEPIYRRDFQKRDGRWLQLYGLKPHDLPPLHEDDFAVAKGGELRYHPLRREWNVYAPHRQNRTFKPSAADDPLAPTRPNAAATEIPFADFELAVFENKFTNFHHEAPPTQDVVGVPSATAKGQCDVVVYTPDAIGNLYSVGQARRKLLLAAWVDRYNYHFAHGADFVLPFESRGEPVGVTLHHPHGQIYAFPNVPNVQANMQQSFEAGYDLAHEVETWSEYDVTRAGGIRAVCPPYARFPFEVWLVPETPVRGPWDFTPEQAEGFAHLLGDITRRYDAHFEGPTAYMLTLHAAPRSAKDWQFTAQFYPLLRAPGRIKYLASVEQGTGMFTVDVMPESAASILKAL